MASQTQESAESIQGSMDTIKAVGLAPKGAKRSA